MNTVPSALRDNRKRGRVGDFLRDKIQTNSRLSIVSAYFTIYAYEKLKDKLNSIEHCDFLFGEPTFIKNIDTTNETKKEFVIEDDKLIIPLEKRLTQKQAAKECYAWIKEKVSIKSMVKPNFLHGKMYHIKEKNGKEYSIIGSSNFTVNGLGLGGKANLELNIEVTDERDRNDLLKWFREIWEDDSGLIEDVKEQVLKAIEKMYVDNSPQFIYFKTLYHIFEDYLYEQKKSIFLNEKTGILETNIWKMLYRFQKDGVNHAIKKLLKYGGCIIADSVGLGKTYEALAIIKYFELRQQRILVICPKRLSYNWMLFKNNDETNPLVDDKFNYDIIYHTDLSRSTGRSCSGLNLATTNWGNYDLIVIDESHNFRNNTKGRIDAKGNRIKSRYEKLLEDIIQKGIATKVLMLSATPVNNNLNDLKNQISIITKGNDNALAETMYVLSLKQTIKKAHVVFSNWADKRKNPERNSNDLLSRFDTDFFKLLDELTIARSRKQIIKFYKSEMKRIGDFPERLPVMSIAPDIDIKNEFPSYDTINEEIIKYKLSLFNPSAYVLGTWKGYYEKIAGTKVKAFTQISREYFLIGMMKINYLKRLESSIRSFYLSINRTIKKIDYLIAKIKEFKEHIQENPEKLQEYSKYLSPNTLIDFDSDALDLLESIDTEDTYDNKNIFVGKKLVFNLAHLNLDLWLEDLQKDRDAMIHLNNSAEIITPDRDGKIEELKNIIRNKFRKPINKLDKINNKKVLIFTAFTDTANYLYSVLKDFAQNELNVHIASLTGGDKNHTTFGKNKFEDIIINFSPRSKQRDKMSSKDKSAEIDILIATDCLSEGQNLQDCDFLINYDIHWNPVRIIQRFGRIDRIGSTNTKIQLVNFWPKLELNKYLNLIDRVHARMELVNIVATGDDNILKPKQIENLKESEKNFRHKQLEELKNGKLDFEALNEGLLLSDFTLDDFRIELLDFIKQHEKKLSTAPMGLYAVVPAIDSKDKEDNYNIKPGVIYCLKYLNPIDKGNKINPLFPYFLAYVLNSGKIYFNYTHPKKILSLYSQLCIKKNKPYEIMCELFDKETENGTKMENYNYLLNEAIKDINMVFKKRVHKKLTTDRSGLLIDSPKYENKGKFFQLITWLVIIDSKEKKFS